MGPQKAVVIVPRQRPTVDIAAVAGREARAYWEMP